MDAARESRLQEICQEAERRGQRQVGYYEIPPPIAERHLLLRSVFDGASNGLCGRARLSLAEGDTVAQKPELRGAKNQ